MHAEAEIDRLNAQLLGDDYVATPLVPPELMGSLQGGHEEEGSLLPMSAVVDRLMLLEEGLLSSHRGTETEEGVRRAGELKGLQAKVAELEQALSESQRKLGATAALRRKLAVSEQRVALLTREVSAGMGELAVSNAGAWRDSPRHLLGWQATRASPSPTAIGRQRERGREEAPDANPPRALGRRGFGSQTSRRDSHAEIGVRHRSSPPSGREGEGEKRRRVEGVASTRSETGLWGESGDQEFEPRLLDLDLDALAGLSHGGGGRPSTTVKSSKPPLSRRRSRSHSGGRGSGSTRNAGQGFTHEGDVVWIEGKVQQLQAELEAFLADQDQAAPPGSALQNLAAALAAVVGASESALFSISAKAKGEAQLLDTRFVEEDMTSAEVAASLAERERAEKERFAERERARLEARDKLLEDKLMSVRADGEALSCQVAAMAEALREAVSEAAHALRQEELQDLRVSQQQVQCMCVRKYVCVCI